MSTQALRPNQSPAQPAYTLSESSAVTNTSIAVLFSCIALAFLTLSGHTSISLCATAAAAAACAGLAKLAYTLRSIRQAQSRQMELFHSCVGCLAAAIDARDSYGREHVMLVEHVAASVGERLGLTDIQLEGLRTAALLLDVGKLGIPENILLHAGRPTEREFAAIHNHPIIGAQILEGVEFPWEVQKIIRAHHERWDGTGYPDKLKGEAIDLGARILAIADVYGALTCNRSYRSKWTHAQAVDYIRSMSGVHFDPDVVRAFDEIEAEIVESRTDSDSDAASQASLSIAQANRQFVALWEISQYASTSLELPQLLTGLAGKVGGLMECEGCAIFLMDPSDPSLVCQAAWPETLQSIVGSSTALMGAGTGRAARERRSLIIKSNRDQLLSQAGRQIEAPYKWSAIAALRTETGECLGTINLYRSQGDFSIEELDLLDVIARHASVPIVNASLYEATRDSAHRDSLTGLFNLRYFCSQLEQEMARSVRLGRPFSLIAVDLDHFKRVNDTLGHPAGDALLRDVARILTGGVREYDTVVRYGGDEFLIQLPESDQQRATETVERLQEALARYVAKWPGLEAVEFGASFGIAAFPVDGSDIKTLLAIADRRMYDAKQASGRSRDIAA